MFETTRLSIRESTVWVKRVDDPRVQGPNGKEIEKCATKCIATCTRGGSGAPGLGPLSVRKAPVVFKEGFRSRSYCLTECTVRTTSC